MFFWAFFAVITLAEAFLSLTLIGQDSPEMADLFELREESGPSLCQEVTNLTSALQEYQLMVQVSSQRSVGTRFWKSARAIVIMDGDQPISTSSVFFPSAGWSWHN